MIVDLDQQREDAAGRARRDTVLAECDTVTTQLRTLYDLKLEVALATATPRFRSDGRPVIHWMRRLEYFMAATFGFVPSTLQNGLWPGSLWGMQQPRYGKLADFDLINGRQFCDPRLWDHVAVYRDPEVKRRTSAIFSAPYGHVDLDAYLRSDDARRFCDTFHVKFVTDFGFEYALDAQPFLVMADEDLGPPDQDRWIAGSQ